MVNQICKQNSQKTKANKHKATGNPFFKNKYEEETRNGKKQLAVIKQSYTENIIWQQQAILQTS